MPGSAVFWLAKWTMPDMVKYRAAIWSFLKLTALYFTISHIVHSLPANGQSQYIVRRAIERRPNGQTSSLHWSATGILMRVDFDNLGYILCFGGLLDGFHSCIVTILHNRHN